MHVSDSAVYLLGPQTADSFIQYCECLSLLLNSFRQGQYSFVRLAWFRALLGWSHCYSFRERSCYMSGGELLAPYQGVAAICVLAPLAITLD